MMQAGQSHHIAPGLPGVTHRTQSNPRKTPDHMYLNLHARLPWRCIGTLPTNSKSADKNPRPPISHDSASFPAGPTIDATYSNTNHHIRSATSNIRSIRLIRIEPRDRHLRPNRHSAPKVSSPLKFGNCLRPSLAWKRKAEETRLSPLHPVPPDSSSIPPAWCLSASICGSVTSAVQGG
jgi:hypothetical protein